MVRNFAYAQSADPQLIVPDQVHQPIVPDQIPQPNLVKEMTTSIITSYLYQIPAAARPSQKASNGDISGTKRGIIAPRVSKQPERILNKKKEEWSKKFKKTKWSKMVQNGPYGPK